MQAEDFTQRLQKMKSVVDEGVGSQRQLREERRRAEEARDEAQAKITELIASNKADLQNAKLHVALRDLYRSWSAAALPAEELQPSHDQEEVIKATSSWLEASSAASTEGDPGSRKRKRTAASPIMESIGKLKAGNANQELGSQSLVETAAEAMLKVQGLRLGRTKSDAGANELEDLAFQLHAAERALLRLHKSKPVMPVFSAVATLCLVASGGARRNRGRLEELRKRVKNLAASPRQVSVILNMFSKDLKKFQSAGQEDGADKWLPHMIEEVIGPDGILEGLWDIVEQSVEAWDLLEDFQLRTRRFVANVRDSQQSSAQLRLLFYWLCADLRPALSPPSLKEGSAAEHEDDSARPWLEISALLRHLSSEFDVLHKGKTETSNHA